MFNVQKSSSFLALSLAATLSTAAIAQDFQASGTINPLPEGIPGTGAVLWDNTNIMNTTAGIVSLEAGTLPVGANQTNSADDFVIPAGESWDIEFVFSTGFTNEVTDVDSFRVTFFDDAAGLPGTEVATRIVPFGGVVTMIEQQLTLPTAVTLSEGTYWVSVIGVYDNFVGLATERWNWSTGPTAIGATAALQDTALLFGGLTWTPLSTLITAPPVPLSTLFALRGSVVLADADISVVKSAAAPSPVMIGSSITYTLAASNAGPGAADAVVVSDTLPANLTYVSNTCAATVAGQAVTWNIGTLASGANATCDVVATVNDFGPIDNTANIASTTNDPTPGNNASTSSLAGAPLTADISITKTAAAPTPLVVGATVTYTLAASNAGPGDADAVVVTDTLPANLTYVSNTCAGTVAGQAFTWNIGTLANAANASCDVVTTVNTFGPIANSASITSTTTDPTPGNNSSSVSLGGAPVPADVAIALSSDAPAGSQGVGSQFNYTVTGSNAGPGAATNLAFALQLSNKVSFVSSSCGAVVAGNSVSWTVANLAIGASTSCVITVAVVASGDLLATASVTTSSVDPSLGNNSADLVVGFAATQVPTLGHLGMLLLGLILAGAAVVVIRR